MGSRHPGVLRELFVSRIVFQMVKGSIFMEGVNYTISYGRIRPPEVWKHLPFIFRPHSNNSDGVLQFSWVRASRKVRYRAPYPYRATVPQTFRARDLGTFEYPTFLVSGVYASPRIIRVVGPWSRYQKRFRLLERMYKRCMHIKRSFPKPPRTLQFPVTLVTYTRISL